MFERQIQINKVCETASASQFCFCTKHHEKILREGGVGEIEVKKYVAINIFVSKHFCSGGLKYFRRGQHHIFLMHKTLKSEGRKIFEGRSKIIAYTTILVRDTHTFINMICSNINNLIPFNNMSNLYMYGQIYYL